MTSSADRAGAVLRIDLDAIVANWRNLSARLAPGARAAAVVKADAYGLGAAHVVPALAAAGCARFVVATIDEGLALRPLLPAATDILILCGPMPGTAGLLAEEGLTPVLNSPKQVADWAAEAKARRQRLPAALHIDTGMARLGLSPAQAQALAGDQATLSAIDLKLVMSHLACADAPAHALNQAQLARFTAARALFPGVPGSLAASSGIFLGPEWHADWVRPGAALYGVHPQPDGPNPMLPVVRLEGRILQVRDVDAGETVGYGATHRCVGPGRLAIVGAGYADGLFRALGNHGSGHLGDCRVPLVGRVSMDLVTFDVTHAPAELARPGGLITLIGPGNTVDDVARDGGTIGYEVLTALGRRYHRVWA